MRPGGVAGEHWGGKILPAAHKTKKSEENTKEEKTDTKKAEENKRQTHQVVIRVDSEGDWTRQLLSEAGDENVEIAGDDGSGKW